MAGNAHSLDRKFIPLSIRFDHALLFTAQVHRNQDRKKSGIPYLSHLLGVASIVMDYGGDEEMAIAALLHDAVEDHGGRPMLRVIEQIFGPRVAKMVDGCTDSYAEDPKKKEIGRRANSATCGGCAMRMLRRASCRPPTSCITSAPCCATCATTGTQCSRAFPLPRRRSSGITARWSTSIAPAE